MRLSGTMPGESQAGEDDLCLSEDFLYPLVNKRIVDSIGSLEPCTTTLPRVLPDPWVKV